MLSNRYSFLYNCCCCSSFHKSVDHICRINTGKDLEMTEMNVKLITGASSGDLQFVTETKFCSRKQYFQTIINKKQQCRAQIPCCVMCCPVYNVFSDQTYVGNIRPAGCFCCKYLDIRNAQQVPIYQVSKQCLSCCPTIFNIKNKQSHNVGFMSVGGLTCQGLFQCYSQIDVSLPSVSDQDKQLLLSSVPFRI